MKKAGPPQRFKVTITETLKRTVEAEADDQRETEQISVAEVMKRLGMNVRAFDRKVW